MKKQKNIIAFIIALITVASLFTACDEEGNGQPSDSVTVIITTSDTTAENVPTSGDDTTRSPETTSEPETTEPETTEPETTKPAETYPEDPNGSKGLTFEKCEGGYSVISIGTCTDKDIIIPRTHNGSLVVKVDKFAFSGSNAETIFVPETVKVLCEGAFEKCYKLTQVTLSEGLEEVGNAVFKDTYIDTVVFPKSVIKYGAAATSQYALVSALAGSNIKHITLGGAIEDFGDMLNNIRVETITFHEGYKVISSDAFDECRNLKKIYLPTTIERVEWVKNSLSTAPDYTIYVNPKSEPNVVFYKHTRDFTRDAKVLAASCFSYNSFKTIDLHEGIISICRSAFYSCQNLESVKIPSTVKYLGNLVFYDCEKLKSITLPDGLEYLGQEAFRDCKSLTSITLPDGIKYVGPGVVSGCTSLQYNEYDNALYIGTKSNPYYMLVKAKSKDIESVEIHKDTKIIDSHAFKDCTKLKSVTVPEGVRRVYGNAFEGCTSLEYLYLPDSLENSPYAPVYKCDQLKRIRLPEGYNTQDLFIMCSAEKITIEGSLKELSYQTFFGKKIVEIKLPDTVEVIGTAAFKNTTELKSLVLPDNVTTINTQAFADSALESLTLPKSVKYIGYKAFLYNGTDKLTITYSGTKEEFKAIEFKKGWCFSADKLSVVCTDGELTYSEINELVSNAN